MCTFNLQCWTLNAAAVFVHWSIRVALAGLEPHSHVRQMEFPKVPKGGLLLPSPHPGEVQPSQLSHQSHTGASMRKVTGACSWEEASSDPFWGCSRPCPFRTHPCSQFGLLMSTEATVMPGRCLLCEASCCCWHWWWVKKQLVLTLGDSVPGICSLGASCLSGWNSSTWKRINLFIVFLKKNPTGMKWADVQAVWWKQFIFQA